MPQAMAGDSALGSASATVGRDYFKELGVRTFINAAGTYTSMTGSLMHKEVTDAIASGAVDFVNLDELQDKAGERIAELIGCEYATVTSGAFAAITLGCAGVLSGMDIDKIKQLPDLTGMKNEVIIQKSHNIVYTHALINTGVTLIQVETEKELRKAINNKTALMWYLNANTDSGQISREDWVKIAKENKVPTFIDCAADVPPVENLWKFTNMGFDLVCFSGGKGIRGPQSAGLLLGKKEYIMAARQHTAPRGYNIGRGLKVNKEEILGMMVALELYLARDHAAEWKMWEAQIEMIRKEAASVDGVTAKVYVPAHANVVPSLRLSWDETKIKKSPDEIRNNLRNGHPSIETVGGSQNIGITTWMMKPGQERIVAKRVREELELASL